MDLKIFVLIIFLIKSIDALLIYFDSSYDKTPNLLNHTFGSFGQFYSNVQNNQNNYQNENEFIICLKGNIEENIDFQALLQQKITIYSDSSINKYEITIFKEIYFEINDEFNISNIIFKGDNVDFPLSFSLSNNASFFAIVKISFLLSLTKYV